jgi:hypothetical protein
MDRRVGWAGGWKQGSGGDVQGLAGLGGPTRFAGRERLGVDRAKVNCSSHLLILCRPANERYGVPRRRTVRLSRVRLRGSRCCAGICAAVSCAGVSWNEMLAIASSPWGQRDRSTGNLPCFGSVRSVVSGGSRGYTVGQRRWILPSRYCRMRRLPRPSRLGRTQGLHGCACDSLAARTIRN